MSDSDVLGVDLACGLLMHLLRPVLVCNACVSKWGIHYVEVLMQASHAYHNCKPYYGLITAIYGSPLFRSSQINTLQASA